MMGKFGWSMPAGAWESTLPGEEDEGEVKLICPECKVVITDYQDGVRPSRVEEWEDWMPAPESESNNPFFRAVFRGDGENRECLVMAGTTVWYRCTNCQTEVKGQ